MQKNIIENKIKSLLKIFYNFLEFLKVKVEVGKLNLDLKNKYKLLGEYVTYNKEKKSIVDFSHDHFYEKKITEIIKLKVYINNQIKSK